MSRPELPRGRRRCVLEPATGTNDAAQADGFGVAGQLVGEYLEVAQYAVQARQTPRDQEGRLVEMIVQSRVVQQALKRAVSPAEGTEEVAHVAHQQVELVGAFVQVAHDPLGALGQR